MRPYAGLGFGHFKTGGFKEVYGARISPAGQTSYNTLDEINISGAGSYEPVLKSGVEFSPRDPIGITVYLDYVLGHAESNSPQPNFRGLIIGARLRANF